MRSGIKGVPALGAVRVTVDKNHNSTEPGGWVSALTPYRLRLLQEFFVTVLGLPLEVARESARLVEPSMAAGTVWRVANLMAICRTWQTSGKAENY